MDNSLKFEAKSPEAHLKRTFSGNTGSIQRSNRRYKKCRKEVVSKPKSGNFSSIIGSSDQSVQLTKMIELCAPSDASILVLGESGSGKEVVTRELHRLSDRCHANLVGINCAAIPDQLLESELFGHKKGAFSGAISDRIGRFQIAHEGTLFLDEIGDMPLELQAKLLRALEERAIVPLGGSNSVPIDVRVIAATHQDLSGMVARGEFREDLFHRLNVIPIKIPPIRERRLDIPEFCLHFASKYSKDHEIGFSPESMSLLSQYDWPGNVREIANLVKRLSVLSPSKTIDLYDLPGEFLPDGLVKLRNESTEISIETQVREDSSRERAAGSELSPVAPSVLSSNNDLQEQNMDSTDPWKHVSEVERIIRLSQSMASIPDDGVETKDLLQNIESNLIRVALNQSEGNVSKAAKLLKLGRTTLIQKMGKK